MEEVCSVSVSYLKTSFQRGDEKDIGAKDFHKDHVIAYYDDLPLAMGRNCHDILIVDDAIKILLRFSMAAALLSAIHGVKIF